MKNPMQSKSLYVYNPACGPYFAHLWSMLLDIDSLLGLVNQVLWIHLHLFFTLCNGGKMELVAEER